MKDQQRKAMFAKRLTLMSKNGKMSEPLRDTILATKTALKNNNYPLATELTSVKSLIVGKMNLPKYPYREDERFNHEKLGISIYLELGRIHSDLALHSGSMPSGMAVISGNKIQKRKLDPIGHPLISNIHDEFKRQNNE